MRRVLRKQWVRLKEVLDQLKRVQWNGPSKHRRAEAQRLLERRPTLSNEEWHRRYAAPHSIPLSFVAWYRDTCSKYFEFDLSAALPTDRLVEDLGAGDATWCDVDLDIAEEFKGEFNVPWPDTTGVLTFGDLFGRLWSAASDSATPHS